MSEPAPRPLVLGASNVARDLGGVAAAALAALPSPPEALWIAAGRGRSYGRASWYWLRRLPSILDSDVWRRLEARGGPTHLLLTDVGNDLAYGVEPETVAAWIERCLARCGVEAGGSVRATVVSLPTAALDELPLAWLDVARRLLFPRCGLDAAALLARAGELDARLAALAAARGAERIVQPASWFGLDPVHLRARARDEAWTRMLASWRVSAAPEGGGDPPSGRWRHRRVAGWPLPERFELAGVTAGRRQPAAHVAGVPLVFC
ncbi:MAG: hypothetical protein AAGC60_06805 [Acidobacteriota bacterium]